MLVFGNLLIVKLLCSQRFCFWYSVWSPSMCMKNCTFGHFVSWLLWLNCCYFRKIVICTSCHSYTSTVALKRNYTVLLIIIPSKLQISEWLSTPLQLRATNFQQRKFCKMKVHKSCINIRKQMHISMIGQCVLLFTLGCTCTPCIYNKCKCTPLCDVCIIISRSRIHYFTNMQEVPTKHFLYRDHWKTMPTLH